MNYETMTIKELQAEYAKIGRVPMKLLATGKRGAMNKRQMIDQLTRWQRDDAIQAKAESWAEANSCKFLGDNPVWKRWIQEIEVAKDEANNNKR